MDIVGQLSVPGSLASTGEFKLGPRMLALFSAAQDTGPDAQAFFQLGWNITYTNVGGTWKFARKIDNNPATSMLIGKQGFEIRTTSQSQGDLNSQLTRVFRLSATLGDEFLYLNKDVHIQNYDGGVARNIEDYRLLTTFFEDPIPIYENKWVGKGTTVFNAHSLGVPSHAKGILVYAHVTAANYSGAGMHFYQRRPTYEENAKKYARGFVAHAPITGTGLGMRNGMQGNVPLGTSAMKGEFVVLRTSDFELANVYISGYLS